MLDKSRDKSRALIFLAAILLVAPISIATVTLSPDTIIEQEANDVDIAVDEQFNVSSLSVYDEATQFGNTNFSITHTNSDLIQANMSEFNGSVEEGGTVTSFILNGSSGETVNFGFENLTDNRYYVLRKNGVIEKNGTTGNSRDFSYSTTHSDSSFVDYSLKASVRDSPTVNVNLNSSEPYSVNGTVGVSGTVTREITGGTIENASVDITVNGQNVANDIQTDSSGNFETEFDTFKTAGEFTVEASASKSGAEGSGTASYSVDEILLENPQFSSSTGDQFVDADEDVNTSVKVYENNQNPIDVVRYRLLRFGSLINQGTMENVKDRGETQRYYKYLEDLGLPVGTYSIKYRAASELNGETINAKENISREFVIQNISVDIDTNRESYGIGSGDNVYISGSATLKDNNTPVNDTSIDLNLINTSSGNSLENITVPMEDDGTFSYSHPFYEEEGLREIEAFINNSNGINGETSTTYSVTDMSVDSIGFSDSDRLHAYNLTGFVSDSTNITSPEDYQCTFIVSDDEGNSETYSQGINTSYGDNQQAKCAQPYIGATNNSNWSHTEELDVELELTKNDVSTSLTQSRSLPNNAPTIVSDTEISLDVGSSDSDTYEYEVSAVAYDGDIPGSNEIEECEIIFYGEQELERSREGSLDKSYGNDEEALCKATLSKGNTSINNNEVIEAQVSFTDIHNATQDSTLNEGPAPFKASVQDLEGNNVDTTFRFAETGSDEVVRELTTDSSGEVYSTVPRGTYDLRLEALNKNISMFDAGISEFEDLSFEIDDTLPQAEVDNASVESTIDELAVAPVDLSYSDAAVTFNYNDEFESNVSAWSCDTFLTEATSRECDDPYEEPKYEIDGESNEITLESSSFDGGYAITESTNWLEGWLTRRSISVTGGQQDLRDYQIKLNLSTQELIREGQLDDDCSNMRFYNTGQTEALDHWLKPGDCGSSGSEVWIEVPYIPANTTRTLYLYTGKSGLEDISSGEDTFLDYDEFNSGISNYDTTGDVSTAGGNLLLRSVDGGYSAATYQSNIEAPYRFMATTTPDSSGEASTLETFAEGTSNSSDSVSLDMVNNIYRNNYSDVEQSIDIDNTELDVNQEITSDTQGVNALFGGQSSEVSLSGSISGSNSPFKASLRENSGTVSNLRVERWFTAKLADSEPSIDIRNRNKQWELYLNNKAEDLSVSPEQVFDIKVNSTGRNSDVTVFINDQEEFESLDTISTTVSTNFSQERYYEVRAEIANIDGSITRDVIVGNDEEAPTLNITGVTQSGGAVDINYNVNDNFLGDLECEAVVNSGVRKENRVEITNTNLNRSANFTLRNLPDGESEFGVRCADQTGNEASDFLPATADLSGPELDILSPENGGSQMRVKPQIKINATDQSTEDIDYSISYRDSGITKTGTITNATASEISMDAPNSYGEKNLEITATDKNGFTTYKVITVDITKPYVEIKSPEVDTTESYRTVRNNIASNRIQTDNESVEFEYEFVTGAQASTQCSLEVDGAEVNSSSINVNTTQTLSAGSIKQGFSMPVDIDCSSTAGTSINDRTHIDVDREKPSIDAIYNSQPNNTVYNPNTNYRFDIAVSDNLQNPRKVTDYGFDDYVTDANPYLEIQGNDGQIVMRSNFTGTMTNNTVSCLEETARFAFSDYRDECQNTHRINDEIIDELDGLSSGKYDYKFYIQDEVGNIRETDYRTYTVEKGVPGLSLDFKPRAQDGNILNGTSPGVRCSASNQEASLELERNESIIDSSTSGSVTDTETLNDPDTYTYNCSIAETDDYNSSFKTFDIDVSGWYNGGDGTQSGEFIEDGINLTLEAPSTATSSSRSFKEGTSDIVTETENNWTITYGGSQTIEASSRSGTEDMYLNDSDISENYERSLTPGRYDFKVNSTGYPKFKPSNITKTVNVEKASPNLDITSNATFRPEVGEFFRLECTSSTTQNNMELYFDGERVDSGTEVDTVSSTFNASAVGRGDYSTECVSKASQNYSSNTVSEDLTVETNTPDMNFEFSSPDKITDLGVARQYDNDVERYAIESGQNIEVKCSTVQPVPTQLEVDGSPVESPYNVTYSENEDYSFSCNTESTPVFDAYSESRTLSVLNKTDTELILNESNSDIEVTQDEVLDLNLSAKLNVSESLEIWELSDPDYRDTEGFSEDDYNEPNSTGYYSDNPRFEAENGTILNKRITGFGSGRTSADQVVPGDYVIHAAHPYSSNHYYSSDTKTVTVTDSTAPRLDVSLESGSFFDTGTFEITANTQDYSSYQCTMSIDGSTQDVQVRNQQDSQDETTPDYSGLTSSWGESADGVLHDNAGYADSDDGDGRVAKLDTNSLSDGAHSLSVTCEDENGNIRDVSKNFKVDTAQPTVSITEETTDGIIQAESSTPNISVNAIDTTSPSVDVEISSETEGPLGSDSVDSGFQDTGEIGLRSLQPGFYEISAEGVDRAGNSYTTDLQTLEIPSNLIYNMDPSSKDTEGSKYIGQDDIQFTFEYADEDAPLDCSIYLDGEEIGSQSNVENKSQTSVFEENITNGRHTWEAQCGPSGNRIVKTSEFIVDTELPTIRDEYVSRDSGLIYNNETVTFAVTAEDNFEVDNANITAEWLSTHPMECDDSTNTCSYQTTVPPGDYDYNFTVCDGANNCKTTDTSNYEVATADESMQLQLNNDTENVTLNETPVLNISGIFNSGERGNAYFSINGTRIAQSLDTQETRFQERFFSNGTYEITADFASTVSDNTDSDSLWVNVNVTEDVIQQFGYNIINLQRGNASLRNDPLFSPTVPGRGIVNRRDVVLGEELGERLAAQIRVNFIEDLDASDISFDTSRSERKSVIDFTRNYNQIEEHSLLVPRIENSGEVLVCPGARTLDDIVLGCEGALNISSGETINGISNTEVEINGDKYYHIDGISGTGAQELSAETTQDSAAQAYVDESETLEEWEPYAPIEDSIDLDGGNISSARLSATQSTDHWAGLYGNASGQLVLGSEDTFYSWEAQPNTIIASNSTIEWQSLQTATVENIDSYYGLDTETDSDSAEDTLLNQTDITIGNTTIEGTPSVKTYNGTEVPTWITGALSDGTSPLFAGKARTNETTAFTGEIANYQMMIPTGRDRIVSYSLYMDLE